MLIVNLLSIGFLLGIRHALEADHMATVAALIGNGGSKKQALTQGVAWGLGHSFALIVFSSVVLWMDITIASEISIGLEVAVSLMMLVLGIDLLRRKKTPLKRAPEVNQIQVGRFPLRSLLIGVLHGMAGSAALVLLFLSSIEEGWQGVLYILIYSTGSMVGMLVFTLIVAFPLSVVAKRFARYADFIPSFIGCVTILIGVALLLEVLSK